MSLLIALYTTSVYSEGRNIIEGRIGGSFNGKFKTLEKNGVEVLGEESSGGGEIVLEVLKETYSGLYLGFGLGYQKHGEAKDIKGESGSLYSSVPTYGTMKYQFNRDSQIQPYLKANLGLSFNRTESGLRKIDESINGFGFYGAIGGGIEIEHFIIDLSYQINTAKTDKEVEENIDVSRITLGLGYRFDF
jgi:hypothetical protein